METRGNTTDVERLHRVVEGKQSGRGCGKSFARCHQLAGHIETGQKIILLVITNYSDKSYLLPMIKMIFDEHNLEFKYSMSKSTIISGESKIIFVTKDDYYRKSRGLEFLEIPMGHWD